MIREAANVQASQIAKPVVRKEEPARESSPRVATHSWLLIVEELRKSLSPDKKVRI